MNSLLIVVTIGNVRNTPQKDLISGLRFDQQGLPKQHVSSGCFLMTHLRLEVRDNHVRAKHVVL